MKINWKVRIKNPIFWTALLSGAVSFCYCVLGAFDVVPKISENELLGIVSAVLTALTTLGVLIDPTTSGISDSALAMTYEAPRKDDFE